jgi:O-antigen/teichoic acid export membrane protein
MTEAVPIPKRGMAGSTALAGSGLLVLGISASVYLVISARMVGVHHFSEIAVLWTLVYTVGIGLFLPFEQELSRASSIRLARGLDLGRLVERAARMAAMIFAVLVPVVAVTMLFHLPRTALFGDSWWYAVALLVAAGGLCVQYLQRGVFSATGTFIAYGGQQGAEGILRMVACVVLAIAGVHEPLAYAAVLAVSPWVSTVIVWPVFASKLAGATSPASYAELRDRLGWLLCATLASQGLANLAAPAVRLMSSDAQQAAAGNFLSGLTIARIPLLLFAAVQAVLLPGLARSHDQGDAHAFRTQLRTVMVATAVIGVGGVVGVGLIGPPVVRLLFGPGFDLPRRDLVLLAASAALLMLALALQSGVIAMDDHRWSGISWVGGVVVFLVGLALPGSVFLRAELALVLGSVVVVGLLGGRVLRDPSLGLVQGRQA